jgi:hypothetical protein
MAFSTNISEKNAQRFEEEGRAAGLGAPWFHPGSADPAQQISGAIGIMERGQDRACGAQHA